ncbi:cation diffusion facilitator family transporter [Sulfurimonas diazotrophicus]|uniref:Cation diffusion facilitator family transporter n=1 Tax=Sulfurimonas diazotrophicus TaxID=3131939 RepID=A0ABZ3H9I9_9BACT
MSGHHHSHDISGTKLLIAVALNILITIAQVAGGLIAGSLALLSDALHNFSDVMALLISWFAHRISHKEADSSRTFGYKRAEIVAALFNASVLAGIGVYLVYASVMRLLYPEPVLSSWLIWMGLLGIVVNGGSIFLLESDARGNMNIRAAYLHLLGDVLTSVAVVLGGVAIALWDIYWIDPLISIIIAVYLIAASAGLIKESTGVLMQFAPADVELDAVADTVCGDPAIAGIHHVHLWRLSDHAVHFEAHLDFAEDLPLSRVTQTVEALEKRLRERFGITHTTFQCEYGRDDDKRRIR